MLREEKISPFFVPGRRKRAELSSVNAVARERENERERVCCIYGVEIAQVVRASASAAAAAAAALAWRGAENKREAAFEAEAKALLLLFRRRRRRLWPYAPSFLLLFV